MMTFQNKLRQNLRANREKTAIEYGEMRISYGILADQADKVTRFLLQRDLGRETIVGIYLQEKADIIASIIGVAQARCVFVLLDSALPESRLLAMCRDMGLQFMIAHDHVPWHKELDEMEVYTWDEVIRDDAARSALVYPDCEANDSLYIYFTSGSTGVPKGVVGKNCSLAKFIEWEISEFAIDGDCRGSQFISPYFDAFLRDVFVPLTAGGTICIPSVEETFSPETLSSWIDRSGVSLIHCVPSLFRIFNNSSLTSERFERLRYVMLSGEKINPAELRGWYDTFGSRIQLVNLYGTTETTMIRSYYRISPDDVNKPRIPVGRPIHDTQLLIANKDLEPCAPLTSGDLYIVSDYCTKGYLNLPDLTAEKFIKIDAGTKDERVAFRTGDKARMLSNKAIELMGRSDRQIKLRGIRIEPDDIERVLIKSGMVENAVVLVKAVPGSTIETLVAFVKRKHNIGSDVPLTMDLLKILKDNLPDYMIPGSMVEVDEYPLLSNGKINHKQLLEGLASENKIIEPIDAVETRLLVLWKEIFGDRAISVEDNFHDVGGSSLSIMKLIARIYQEYKVRVSLSEFFSNLTIRKQAQLIRRLNKDSVLEIVKSDKQAMYNLSAAQERIYYNYVLNKTSTAYNLPMAFEIRGEVDIEKIKNALARLVERHEALRTEYVFNGEKIVQNINGSVDLTCQELMVADADVTTAIHDFAKPFDLSYAPLMRSAIITTPENRTILLTDIHHIACDGMSQKILFTDFLKLYRGEVLSPLALQYKDFAEWEYQFRSSIDFKSYREFWVGNFVREIPEFTLPTLQKERTDEPSDLGESIIFSIGRDVLDPMIETLKKEQVTTFSALFSAYFIFMSQLAGQEDLVVGINTSGRTQHGLHDMVGMFAKTLPVRYQLAPSLSFSSFATNVHKHLIEVNSNQMYDLTQIVSELNKTRNSPIAQLFSVLFVFQNFEEEQMKAGDTEFLRVQIDSNTAKYPITLFVYEHDDMFLFKLEYALSYFTRSDIDLLVDRFKLLIARISSDTSAPILEALARDKNTPSSVAESISFNF